MVFTQNIKKKIGFVNSEKFHLELAKCKRKKKSATTTKKSTTNKVYLKTYERPFFNSKRVVKKPKFKQIVFSYTSDFFFSRPKLNL